MNSGSLCEVPRPSRVVFMSAPRVLIVEDEPMVAMDLELIVLGVIAADVVVVASVSGARQAMAAPLDLALLDIEVTDGRTFEIARELQRNGAAFVFISGARPRSASSRPAWRAVHFQAVRPTSDRTVLREQSAVRAFRSSRIATSLPTRPRNPEGGGRPAPPGCFAADWAGRSPLSRSFLLPNMLERFPSEMNRRGFPNRPVHD